MAEAFRRDPSDERRIVGRLDDVERAVVVDVAAYDPVVGPEGATRLPRDLGEAIDAFLDRAGWGGAARAAGGDPRGGGGAVVALRTASDVPQAVRVRAARPERRRARIGGPWSGGAGAPAGCVWP